MNEAFSERRERSTSPFEPGDRVMLTADGPRMTVIEEGSHPGTVWCQWPHDDGFEKGVFLASHLRADYRPEVHVGNCEQLS